MLNHRGLKSLTLIEKITDCLTSQIVITRDLTIRSIRSHNKERMESKFYTIRDGSFNGYC